MQTNRVRATPWCDVGWGLCEGAAGGSLKERNTDMRLRRGLTCHEVRLHLLARRQRGCDGLGEALAVPPRLFLTLQVLALFLLADRSRLHHVIFACFPEASEVLSVQQSVNQGCCQYGDGMPIEKQEAAV
jgi:hypothetical protein